MNTNSSFLLLKATVKKEAPLVVSAFNIEGRI